MSLKKIISFFVLLLSLHVVYGHVELDMPVGGEKLQPGDPLVISWRETIEHMTNNWDLYYSIDDGENWSVMKEDLDIALRTYTWTIPDTNTSKAKIRVVQDNVNSNYDDVSDRFTIGTPDPDPDETILGVNPIDEEKLLKAYPNPFDSKITLCFGQNNSEKRVVSIYSMSGQHIIQLEVNGNEKISWQPAGLQKGTYIVKYIDKNRPEFQYIILK